MEITKEWVQQRIEALTNRQNQLIAEVNAVAGALASMNDLLALLDAPAPEPGSTAPADKEPDDVLGNLAKSE